MDLEYEAPDGCWYESPQDYLWVGVLGGCGCGSGNLPERAYEVLNNFGKPHMAEDRFRVYDDPANEVIAHWLDSKGLIEHGGSVGGSWLTKKGQELLELINTATQPSNKSKE